MTPLQATGGWERFVETFFKPAMIAQYWPDILKGVLVTVEIAGPRTYPDDRDSAAQPAPRDGGVYELRHATALPIPRRSQIVSSSRAVTSSSGSDGA